MKAGLADPAREENEPGAGRLQCGKQTYLHQERYSVARSVRHRRGCDGLKETQSRSSDRPAVPRTKER